MIETKGSTLLEAVENAKNELKTEKIIYIKSENEDSSEFAI